MALIAKMAVGMLRKGSVGQVRECATGAFPIFGIRHVTRVSLSVQDVRSDDEED